MDINQLIDSDTSGSRSKKEVEKQHTYPPGYQQRREQRPPQPPPLRPPLQNEFRSPSTSSYNSAHSPYQKTPSSALSTGQYPFPQPSIHSPANSTKAISGHQYEAQSFATASAQQVYGQTVSLPQTPTTTTPGSSYPPFQQQRPPSSHSASTPTSGHAQTPTFPRDSPQQTHAQIRGPYGPNPNHQYLSQPGTPLGPPTSLGRQGSSLRRESPSSYDHKRSNSGGSLVQQLQTVQSPTNILHNPSTASSVGYAAQRTQSPPQQDMSMSLDRERSISVSPKTRIPRQLSSIGAAIDTGRIPIAHVTPAKRKIGDPRVDEPALQEQPAAKRSMSLGVGGILNADNENETRTPNKRSHVQNSNLTQSTPRSEIHGSGTENHSSVNPKEAALSHSPSRGAEYSSTLSSPSRTSFANQDSGAVAAEHTDRSSQAPSIQKGPLVASSTSSVHPSIVQEPSNQMSGYSNSVENKTSPQLINTKPSLRSPKPWKRFRDPKAPIPIFAQRFNRRGGPSNNTRPQAMARGPPVRKSDVQGAALHPSIKQETNGHVVSGMDATQSMPDSVGGLGPWEPTITGVIPAEELTREIMDYIIQTVAPMKSPVLDMIEIEAKIGHIIDKDTDVRIRLPGRTEVMVDHTNPSLRTAFRSSMTESQHQQLNKFLNKCLADSQPPLPGTSPREPRVPLTYVHTRVRDTFFDLTQDALNALPPSILGYVDRRKKPKVRVTTDQKDGTQLAKIIKIRVSDREIHSPKTPFDWRVSVNLEMNYDGDMRGLVETTEGKDRRKPDRNKDRVSYKHGPYQIDLTQVKPTEIAYQGEKEHELEIEVSSAAIRQQTNLVLHHQPNRYEDLVQGFVDNVRTLARFCKER
ncbi:MAG: hypothetical protein Q9178_005570 [Gyalolechia marmorata]